MGHQWWPLKSQPQMGLLPRSLATSPTLNSHPQMRTLQGQHQYRNALQHKLPRATGEVGRSKSKFSRKSQHLEKVSSQLGMHRGVGEINRLPQALRVHLHPRPLTGVVVRPEHRRAQAAIHRQQQLLPLLQKTLKRRGRETLKRTGLPPASLKVEG